MKWILILMGLAGGISVAEPVCTNKNIVSLRKGPGTQHPLTWKVARHMPFMRTERKGGWVKLEDLEGEVHWARSSDVTSKIRCVVVKTNVATLRSAPSTTAPPIEIATADRYTPFKRLETQREWVQIEDETGRKAWIHESQIWKPVTVNAISF